MTGNGGASLFMRIKTFIKNRSKKTWFTLGLVLLLVISVGLIAKNLSSPSQGTIKVASKTTVQPKGPDEAVRIDGKTISFSHPSRFHQGNQLTLDAADIEKYALLNPQTIPQNITIQVRKLPSGNLSDDSSYNLRKLYPNKYIAETKTINGNSVVIMSEPGAGFSKVAFLTHNGLEAVVASTSSSTSTVDAAGMQSALDKILGGWQWL